MHSKNKSSSVPGVIRAAAVFLGVAGAALWVAPLFEQQPARPTGYSGSEVCRPCHEEFYAKWAQSHHGRAMQPFTAELARTQLTEQPGDISIGAYRYRVELSDSGGSLVENGPQGGRRYPIQHALGGKNVFYFLTKLERGRLQTLPVAYDVARKEWFDTSASGMRHFNDVREEQVFWREYPYTFNSSCHGCHVSQLSTNYDRATDSYATSWAEPGINCETCHGPGEEHVREAQAHPEAENLKSVRIIRYGSDLTPAQRNDSCAQCHAKMSPVTSSFRPGERFFDHFDLVTLENPDFYPDGRDLGENYTQTQWLMNPCARSGRLECIHCHTSSGRYRFTAEERANDSCMPCHEDKVRDASAHTRHPAGNPANRCISCHMPVTEFARMRRSDHSFRPPAPAATLAFKSPNACNLCHKDKDAAWADRQVRRRRAPDYQAAVLEQSRLVAAARRQDWSRLPDILSAISGKNRDEIVANSLIRLLHACNDPRKRPVLLAALDDPSPLVRASAAAELADNLQQEHVPALVRAARDEFRLVRVRAGTGLARVPPELLAQDMRPAAERAVKEYVESMIARPDDYASQYNLGNYYMALGRPEQAVASFENSLRFEPRFVQALVNSSLAYNELGRNDQARQNLRRALEADPGNVAAQLNLSLLLAEIGRHGEAVTGFRKVLDADPSSAVAAYNLGVLLADENLDEAIGWFQKAFQLQPCGKYGFSLAFYLHRKGDTRSAIEVLRRAIEVEPRYADAHRLLARLTSP
jgi:tetratricopeptide (TPR) repeat protein